MKNRTPFGVNLLAALVIIVWTFPAWSLDSSKIAPSAARQENIKPPPYNKLPDLKVDKVFMSKTAEPYTPAMEFKWGNVMVPVCEFSNTGGDLNGNWKIRFLLDGKVEGTISRGNIAAGSHQKADMGMLVTTGYSQGSHTLECILDPDGAITEATKNNNKMSTPFQIVK